MANGKGAVCIENINNSILDMQRHLPKLSQASTVS